MSKLNYNKVRVQNQLKHIEPTLAEITMLSKAGHRYWPKTKYSNHKTVNHSIQEAARLARLKNAGIPASQLSSADAEAIGLDKPKRSPEQMARARAHVNRLRELFPNRNPK